MAKTLPIQLVKTREKQDEFLKEAGGSVRSIEQTDIRVEDLEQIFKKGNLIASNFNLNQKVFEFFK